MDLERLAVALRPRTRWEAVDLGLAMVRAWWRELYAPWLLLGVPLALVLVAGLGRPGLVLFWWLLPLAEVAVVFRLSRIVFGSVPDLGATLRALPALWPVVVAELGPLRRLHPARAHRLPVAVLEGLRGGERRQRLRGIAAAGEETIIQLALVHALFVAGVAMALVAAAALMTPSWLGFDWAGIGERFFAGEAAPGLYTAAYLVLAAAILALGPWRIAVGFALYLDGRTRFEGWDLEIAFRRLARRLVAARHPRGRGAGRAAALLLVAVVAAWGPTLPAAGEAPGEAAAESLWQGQPERDPRRVIREVTVDEATETRHRWVLRPEIRERLEAPADAPGAPPAWLLSVVRAIDAGRGPVLWGLAAVAAVLLLSVAWRRWGGATPARRAEAPPERLFGLDVRPESLPADVPAAAEALWRDGHAAAAVGLLYRAALARLVAEGVTIRASDTEDDALALAARRGDGPRLRYLALLTRAWQAAAYAHRPPAEEAARGLWTGWGEHFAGVAARGAGA